VVGARLGAGERPFCARLRRIIISHGDVIDTEPREALRELAATLK
jgi:hypothetical protein